jgi:ABC-type transport system involved in multi-copper enzyme maturation permease subunit
MNPLVKKEIRLLLPGFLAVLSLEILSPWALMDMNADMVFGLYAPMAFFLGIIVLAIDSFGREFGVNTFPLLMSQPVERRQIWWTKVITLFLASAVIFAAYFATCELRLHLAIAEVNSIWHVNPKLINNDFSNSMIASVAIMLIALTGGLWTSLLLRQTTAAFWVTLLTPIGLFFLIALVMSKVFHSTSDVVAYCVLYGVAGIYSLAGFWLAHRLFRRAQDTAWTGGIIDFSRWRYFESARQARVSERRHRPVAALLKKEFQLHSVSLICAGALLVVHLAVIVMRKVHGQFAPNSLEDTVSQFYWSLWLVMPLVIGCTAVAEERRLGVMEGQFCLPATRRLQFILKFFPVIFAGLFFGALMPLLVERMAAAIGAPNPDFQLDTYGRSPVSDSVVTSIALGLSLAGFFASTLTKNFLQALGAAIATLFGCCLFTYVILNFHSALGVGPSALGPTAFTNFVTIYISILTALVVFPRLASSNLKYFLDGRRTLRRNVFGLAGAILFILVSSAALYNRVWEVFEPAEPPHGPAMLSLKNPPAFLHAPRDNLLVRLPDGRIWFDVLQNQWAGITQQKWRLGRLLQLIKWNIEWKINPLPNSAGPQRYLSGSNWVSAVAGNIDTFVHEPGSQNGVHVSGYLDSVGIQSDGTLWVSGKSDQDTWTSDKLTQFGNGTNWQQVASPAYRPVQVLLLKNDGTLWLWGTNRFDWLDWPQKWPGLRAFQPHQIGTNSDWRDISSMDGYLARNASGAVWQVEENYKNGTMGLVRDTNYDEIPFEKNAQAYESGVGSYIRKNGTLWRYVRVYIHNDQNEFRIFQCGRETNWVSSAATWDWMVALKSDGTLWKWDSSRISYPVDFSAPPTRLGIHKDWVALASAEGGVVSLAADGSLWFWPQPNTYYNYWPTLLNLPKQPQFLGNVFGKGY